MPFDAEDMLQPKERGCTMKASRGQTFSLLLTSFFLAECTACGQKAADHAKIITVTAVQAKTVTIRQQYVCQIHAQHYATVHAPKGGYFKGYHVRENQAVKKGDLLFKIAPIASQEKLDAALAEVQNAQLEFDFVNKLFEKKGVYEHELKLRRAKLAKARAKAELAEVELNSDVELNSTNVVAPFDGIIDRMIESFGSLVEKGDIFMSVGDISTTRVYFNVPESCYLEYMAKQKEREGDTIELVLTNGDKFPHAGKLVGKLSAIEPAFNSETGNVASLADFPNPKGLLRHGQTGTVLVNRTLKDAVIIPRRATLEALNKRYVYLVDNTGIAHRREVVVGSELDGEFVVKTGVRAGDKIVLDGVGLVHDGDKME